jgi:hypothetical protein
MVGEQPEGGPPFCHFIVTTSRCPDRRKILTTTVAPCLITSKSIELGPTFKSRILTRCRDSGRQG